MANHVDVSNRRTLVLELTPGNQAEKEPENSRTRKGAATPEMEAKQMTVKSRGIQMVNALAIIFLGVTGIYVQMYPFKWFQFTYYTVLSNSLVVLFFGLHLVLLATGGTGVLRSKGYIRVKAAVTTAILMTFFTFGILLLPKTAPSEVLAYDNLAVHFIVPILVAADWLLFDPRGSYRRIEPLLWTALPLTYLFYALVRGIVFNVPIPESEDSPFPYFFLNGRQIGWGAVTLYCVVMLVLFVLLGYAMYWVKRKKRT